MKKMVLLAVGIAAAMINAYAATGITLDAELKAALPSGPTAVYGWVHTGKPTSMPANS